MKRLYSFSMWYLGQWYQIVVVRSRTCEIRTLRPSAAYRFPGRSCTHLRKRVALCTHSLIYVTPFLHNASSKWKRTPSQEIAS